MATKAKTLEDFRAAHDRNVIVPNKIREALAQLLKIGPEHYEYENEFIKLAGISQTDMGMFRDQFADYFLETTRTNGGRQRRVWFGDKKVVAKVRG
jgi:hypothetical protein